MRRAGGRVLSLGLLVLLPVDLLLASHQIQDTSTPQTPVFRASVDYVLADVVVTDTRDQPVRGLTIDDFEIILGDKFQRILEFKEIVIPPGNREIVTTA